MILLSKHVARWIKINILLFCLIVDYLLFYLQALRRELEIKDSLLREETNLSARTAIESQVALSLQDKDDKILRYCLHMTSYCVF